MIQMIYTKAILGFACILAVRDLRHRQPAAKSDRQTTFFDSAVTKRASQSWSGLLRRVDGRTFSYGLSSKP